MSSNKIPCGVVCWHHSIADCVPQPPYTWHLPAWLQNCTFESLTVTSGKHDEGVDSGTQEAQEGNKARAACCWCNCGF